MQRPSRTVLATAALALAAGAYAGPPSLILTGQIGSDLSGDGLTAVGPVWDITVGEYIVYTYTPGVGAYRTGTVQDNDPAKCSADGAAISFPAYDVENFAGLGTDRLTPHLWTLSGGTTNLGRPPNGTSCDAFTFSPNDISGNGRYIVGGGYTQTTCGPYRAMRYDTVLASWEQLPVSISPPPLNAPASLTRADAVSADGTVVVGYDQNYDASLTQSWRGAAVWVKNGATWTQTILDRYTNKVSAVSADGNTLAGQMSATTMQETFGTTNTTPVRWTRSGSNWVPHNLGGTPDMRPVAVSADGSTIVGFGGGDGGFIWRADLNGGVPMSLSQHVADLGGSFPGLTLGSVFGSPVVSISDDGNTILVRAVNDTNPCLIWSPGAILALNGAPCDPANVVLDPVSHYNPAGPIDEPYGMVFNCFIAGSWPMNIQWQKESAPGSGVWEDLADDNCAEYLPEYFNFRGTDTMQLRLGGLDGVWSGRYRCTISNACGATTSRAFRAAVCLADYNCDGFVDGIDSDEFNNDFESADPQVQERADMNGDGFVDGIDSDIFNNAFNTGC